MARRVTMFEDNEEKYYKGRWIYTGDLKLSKESLEAMSGDLDILDNIWNSPVYLTESPYMFRYFVGEKTSFDPFDNLPFKAFGKGH